MNNWIARWQAMGISLVVSLNVSSLTANDPDWIVALHRLTGGSLGLTKRMTVENTETAAIHDLDQSIGDEGPESGNANLLLYVDRWVDGTFVVDAVLLEGALEVAALIKVRDHAPQVLWRDFTPGQLTLAGRTSLNDRAGMNIASRTIDIDPWARAAINSWKAEQSTNRPVHDDDSMLYTGTQALTSNSAAVSADQQIKKALKLAGLAEYKGLTAGSLRLWSILKDATDLASAATAARHGGITIVTLHTKVQNLLDLAEA